MKLPRPVLLAAAAGVLVLGSCGDADDADNDAAAADAEPADTSAAPDTAPVEAASDDPPAEDVAPREDGCAEVVPITELNDLIGVDLTPASDNSVDGPIARCGYNFTASDGSGIGLLINSADLGSVDVERERDLAIEGGGADITINGAAGFHTLIDPVAAYLSWDPGTGVFYEVFLADTATELTLDRLVALAELVDANR